MFTATAVQVFIAFFKFGLYHYWVYPAHDHPMHTGLTSRKLLYLSWGLYVSLVARIIIWAVTMRFQLPQSPLVDNDTPGYINPALSMLTGSGYVHEHGRNFVYPGLLFLLLHTFGDFRAIAVFQHVLGILGGGLLLLTWERASLFLRSSPIPKPFYRALGLVLTVAYLASTKPMLFESQIRPESVFAFFAILSLFLNVEFIRVRFLEHKKTQSFVFGILSLFTAVLLNCLRPAWGFGVIFSSLPVLVSLLDGAESVRRKCSLIGTAVFLILAFLIFPEKYLSKDDREKETFGARVVFAIHADMIRDQIGADLADGSDTPYPKDWLASVQAALSSDIEKTAAFPQESLGFNSDYIMWEDSSFNKITHDFGGDPHKVATFCWYYYRRTVLHQPWRMTQKILRQMQEFYTVPCPVYQKREHQPLKIAKTYEKSSRVLSGYMSGVTIWGGVRDYLARCELIKTTNVSIPGRGWAGVLHRLLGSSYLACLITAITVNLLMLAFPRWRSQLGTFALFTLLVYSYNFGNCLTAAIVHTLEVRRYSHAQLGFTMLAQFLTFLLLLEVAVLGWKEIVQRFRAKGGRV